MNINLTALDTLFFRDGKPFTMGEDTVANCVFPPNPTTVLGALRAMYLRQHPLAKKALEENDEDATIDFQLMCQALTVNTPEKGIEKYLFPHPLDLVQIKGHKNGPLKVLKLLNAESSTDPAFSKAGCSYGLSHFLLPQNDHIVEDPGANKMLDAPTLEDYLSGKNSSEGFESYDIEPLLKWEPRIGIGREMGTLTSKEGHLYRTAMLRTQDKQRNQLGIFAQLEGGKEAEKIICETLTLGGEGKISVATQVETPPDLKLEENWWKNGETGMFKLCFMTPGVFNNGWIPEGFDQDTFTGPLGGTEVKLIAATIGKPQYIGGFDVKAGVPKPMHRAVPAGSVYYFELLDKTSSPDLSSLHLSKLSKDDFATQGYGLVMLGAVHKF